MNPETNKAKKNSTPEALQNQNQLNFTKLIFGTALTVGLLSYSLPTMSKEVEVQPKDFCAWNWPTVVAYPIGGGQIKVVEISGNSIISQQIVTSGSSLATNLPEAVSCKTPKSIYRSSQDACHGRGYYYKKDKSPLGVQLYCN